MTDSTSVPVPPAFPARVQAAFRRIDARALVVLGDRALIVGPYDECYACDYLSSQCDGPGLLTMPLIRWCIWCAKVAALRELTYARIAEQSGVSLSTVTRILSLDPPDNIRLHTAAAITKVIVGSAGKHPCAKHIHAVHSGRVESLEREVEALSDRVEELGVELEETRMDRDKLKNTLTGIHESYNAEIEKVRAEAQRKIDFLTKEIERKNQLILQQDERIDKLIAKVIGN